MQNGDHAMKHDDSNDPALIPTLRWMSDMACLWGLCRNAACGRARQCRRDPRSCLRRRAPLVPDEVRGGVALMLGGKQQGVSYEDLRAQAPVAIAAVEDWIARVKASASSSSGAIDPGNGG